MSATDYSILDTEGVLRQSPSPTLLNRDIPSPCEEDGARHGHTPRFEPTPSSGGGGDGLPSSADSAPFVVVAAAESGVGAIDEDPIVAGDGAEEAHALQSVDTSVVPLSTSGANSPNRFVLVGNDVSQGTHSHNGAHVSRGRPASAPAARQTLISRSQSSAAPLVVRPPPKTAKAAAAAYHDLSLVLAPHGVEHLCDVLVASGWTVACLHELTEADLNRLKVTGRALRSGLMAAADDLKKELAMSPVERLQRQRMREGMYKTFGKGGGGSRGPREGRAAGIVPKAATDTMTPGMAVPADDGAESSTATHRPEFTATLPTANEHARQATIFLEHQRLDRAWPNAHSKLSQTLNLSHAAPADTGPMYRINLNGKTTTVCPPHRHNQGFQAKFCPCCAEFVAESLPGKWQFLSEQRVVTGEGEEQVMTVWKDFKDSESVSIEYAKKRMNPSVKIRKSTVSFKKMLWGDRPIRRVNAKSVPFPSLKKGQIEHVPPNDADAANGALQEAIDAMNRALVSDTEETKNRILIEQQEAAGIQEVLADIAIMMAQLFYDQRAALEAEEARARAQLEGTDFEAALDELYAFEEKSVREVEVRRWENQSAAIYRQQYACLEEMELNKRMALMEEEETARANLAKLLALFNDQVRHVLAVRKAKFLEAQRGGKGGRSKASEGSLDGRRCPVCRKTNCVFFHKPWKGRWRERGGALDLQPPILDTVGDLTTLVARANAHEYEEDEKTRAAAKEERKAQRRLMSYLGLGPPPSAGPTVMISSGTPAKALLARRASSTMPRDQNHSDSGAYAADGLLGTRLGGAADAEESILREGEYSPAAYSAVPNGDGRATPPPRPATSLIGGGSTTRRLQRALHDSYQSSAAASMQRPASASAAGRGARWSPPRPTTPFLPTGGGTPLVSAYSVTRNTKRTSSVGGRN